MDMGRYQHLFYKIPLNIAARIHFSCFQPTILVSIPKKSLTLGFAHSRGTVHSQHINESDSATWRDKGSDGLGAWRLCHQHRTDVSGFSFLYSFFIMDAWDMSSVLGLLWFVCACYWPHNVTCSLFAPQPGSNLEPQQWKSPTRLPGNFQVL